MSNITAIKESEYDRWAEMWRAFLGHGQVTLPEEQYENTWNRIQDPNGDLHALVARDETGKVIGLSHYYFTPIITSAHPQCRLGSKWAKFNTREIWLSQLTDVSNTSQDLFVDPKFRRQGIGRALILATAEKAYESGCHRMQWDAWYQDYDVHRLYDSIAVSKFKQYNVELPLNQW